MHPLRSKASAKYPLLQERDDEQRIINLGIFSILKIQPVNKTFLYKIWFWRDKSWYQLKLNHYGNQKLSMASTWLSVLEYHCLGCQIEVTLYANHLLTGFHGLEFFICSQSSFKYSIICTNIVIRFAFGDYFEFAALFIIYQKGIRSGHLKRLPGSTIGECQQGKLAEGWPPFQGRLNLCKCFGG
jgi:hypothetical protein